MRYQNILQSFFIIFFYKNKKNFGGNDFNNTFVYEDVKLIIHHAHFLISKTNY